MTTMSIYVVQFILYLIDQVLFVTYLYQSLYTLRRTPEINI